MILEPRTTDLTLSAAQAAHLAALRAEAARARAIAEALEAEHARGVELLALAAVGDRAALADVAVTLGADGDAQVLRLTWPPVAPVAAVAAAPSAGYEGEDGG